MYQTVGRGAARAWNGLVHSRLYTTVEGIADPMDVITLSLVSDRLLKGSI
jgi:hypothetical protein